LRIHASAHSTACRPGAATRHSEIAPRLARRPGAEALDQPLPVVPPAELLQGYGQLGHRGEVPDPEQVLLQGPDEPFGDAMALRLPDEVGLDGPARSSRFGILRRTVSSHLRKIARLPAQLTDPCLIPDPRAAAPDQLASENEERERASQRDAKALAWRERFRYDFLLTHGDNAPLTIRQSR